MQTTITMRQFTRRAQTTLVGLGLLAAGLGGAVALNQVDLHRQHLAAPLVTAPDFQGPTFWTAPTMQPTRNRAA